MGDIMKYDEIDQYPEIWIRRKIHDDIVYKPRHGYIITHKLEEDERERIISFITTKDAVEDTVIVQCEDYSGLEIDRDEDVLYRVYKLGQEI